MLKGLWIRLDVPYSKDAKQMRAVLAYSEPGKQAYAKLLKAIDKNIPEAVKNVVQQAAASSIVIDSGITLVYPLDDRHLLAGSARDEADKRKYKFSRNVPDMMELPVALETGYESFDTGSVEDTYDLDQARSTILALNDDANDSFNSNDLLEAMGPLRHALWLALRHYGWKHPATAYTLRNLGYTLGATGNRENEAEVKVLLLKLIYLCQAGKPLDASVWDGSEGLLDELASLCASLNMEKMGAALLAMKAALSK